jgi:hypothetical protein
MRDSIVTISVLILASLIGIGILVKDNQTFKGTIPSEFQIGDKVKSINFTDDNTGEGFIIKTDSKDYFSLGGNSIVYFTITDLEQDQTGTVAFSFSDKLSVISVKKFLRNDERTETSGTSTNVVKSEVWSDVLLAKVQVPNVSRKSINGRKTDKGFSDNFVRGETNLYRAEVKIPKGTENDEFFIEAFGSQGAYGHLDPNAWTYEQLFNTLNDGNLSTQDSWSLFGGNDWQVETTVKYEGAKAISVNDDAAQSREDRSITPVSGANTVYRALRATRNDSINHLQFIEGAYVRIYAGMYTDGHIYIKDKDNTGSVDLGTYSADTWYVLEVNFNTTTDKVNGRVFNGTSWSSLSADLNIGVDVAQIDKIRIASYCDFAVTNYIDTITPNNPVVEAVAAPVSEDSIIIEEE